MNDYLNLPPHAPRTAAEANRERDRVRAKALAELLRCQTCGGYGYVRFGDLSMNTCPTCKGTGKKGTQ